MDEKQNQSENIEESPIENITTKTNDTKPKKKILSFSNVFITLLLIIIVIMGIYIYKQNQAEQKAACVIDPLTNNKIISNSINNTTNIENSVLLEPVVNEKITIMTERQSEKAAKETLEKYLEQKLNAYENNTIGPMPYILAALNLDTEENLNILCSRNYDPTSYIRYDTKYIDFKNALLQYVSEEYFTKNFSQYKNINDNVAFCNCAGGSIYYGLDEIKFISRNNDLYEFDVTLIDLEVYNHANIPNENENITKADYLLSEKITFKLVDEKLVIHEF